MHRKVVALLVAGLALGIASCGGSEPALTRAQLVTRVEAACKQARTVTERRTGSNPAALARAMIAGQQVMVERIEDLNPPSAAQDEFATFKQGMQDRLDQFERIASASGADQQRAVRAAAPQIEATSRRLSAAAESLGIERCT